MNGGQAVANRSPVSVLPSTCPACNGASVIGIRNIAKLQTQKCQTQGPEKKKQKGEALALSTLSLSLSLLLAGSWRDHLPCSLPLLTLQDDPVNTKPSPMAPQSQGFSFRSHAR